MVVEIYVQNLGNTDPVKFYTEGSAYYSYVVTSLAAAPGPIGATGAQGEIGSTGATGAQGSTGPTGATGAGFSGLTSTSTVTIGTGTKTFTVNTDATASGFQVGSVVSVRATASPSGAFGVGGFITSFSGTTLSMTATSTVGSGTYTNWSFNIAGFNGATGAVGSTGNIGATGAIGETGATGSQGNIGATGAQGIQGVQGATGAQGEIGASGSTGATGPQGAQGFSSGRFYYFNQSKTEIGAFKELGQEPTTATQQTVTVSAIGNTSTLVSTKRCCDKSNPSSSLMRSIARSMIKSLSLDAVVTVVV
jgi:hypothetical protein